MKKKIKILILFFLLILVISISFLIGKSEKIGIININKKQENYMQDIIFEVCSNENNILEILITARDTEFGISNLIYQTEDGIEKNIEGNGKQTVSIDYIITENGTYEFKMINTEGKETVKQLVIDDEYRNRGTWSEIYEITSDYIDKYGNIAKIPAGFQVWIKYGENTVTDGLVIKNATDGSEFVWVPVGTVYKNIEHTEYETIELSRYTFDSSGNPIKQNDSVITISGKKYQELAEKTSGNIVAKDIENFKTSAINNGGYYIGRYEAGDAVSTSKRNSSSLQTNTMVCKSGVIVYNNITQPNAALLCREMYTNDEFTSDLINSYAWDTAIVFVQTFDDRTDKSKKYSLQGQGIYTNFNEWTGAVADKICNIYNMASNITEWTTETCTNYSSSCVCRGGLNGSAAAGSTTVWNTSVRVNRENTSISSCFRPILYIN